ncbi:MAG: hypothetical protein ACFFDN_49800, partial [Candidatus Hodarchaeota archaeon]
MNNYVKQSLKLKIYKTLLFLIFIILFFDSGFCQNNLSFTTTDTIRLKSRQIILSSQTTDHFFRNLRLTKQQSLYGIVKLKRNPNIDERKELEKSGLFILAPVKGTVYHAKISKDFRVKDKFVQNLFKSLSLLQAQDKVTPNIWEKKYHKYLVTRQPKDTINYVLNDDGTLNLTVIFYTSINEDEIKSLLKAHTQSYEKLSDTRWSVVVTQKAVSKLAAENIVRWIDAGPIPFLPENDQTRAAINVNTVQNFDVTTGQIQGLGGQGVQVGIFEWGIDETHNDFDTHDLDGNVTGNRVVVNDADKYYHTTHVAGIVGGSGWQSNRNDSKGNNNGGSAFQWRGMAPEVEFLDTRYEYAYLAEEMF